MSMHVPFVHKVRYYQLALFIHPTRGEKWCINVINRSWEFLDVYIILICDWTPKLF